MKLSHFSRYSTFIILTLFVSLTAAIPPASETLEKIRNSSNLPALSYVVLQDGEVRDLQAAGLRRTNSTIRVTVNDKWHLGSCGKAITSTMAARLVEKRVLSWNSTLRSVFGASHPGVGNVTLQQLLTHTAGLPRDPDRSYLVCLRHPEYREQRACGVRLLLARPPHLPPGAQFSYSNFGYIVAAAMAERVSGKSFATLMREEVFGPLGINGYGFGSPASGNRDAQPWGHARREGVIEPVIDRDILAAAPAGLMHMSLQDWARFAKAHLEGERSGLLGKETFERLHTPVRREYAFGWVVRDDLEGLEGRVAWWHNGSNGFWQSVAVLVPELDTAVMLVTNIRWRGPVKKAFDAVMKEIIIPRFLAGRV